MGHFLELVALCIYSTDVPPDPIPRDEMLPKVTSMIVDYKKRRGVYRYRGQRETKVAPEALVNDEAERRGWSAPRGTVWPGYSRAHGLQPQWQKAARSRHGGGGTAPRKLLEKPPRFDGFGVASSKVWSPVLRGDAASEMILDFVRDTEVIFLPVIFYAMF